MLKLSNFFNRTKQNNSNDGTKYIGATNSVSIDKNWHEERVTKVSNQRNLLLVLSFLLLIIITLFIVAITILLNLRKFDPFVIQVDDTTGAAQIVTPITSDILNGNDELSKYFIKKYVIARETYNPVDFSSLARRTVQLFSSQNIFRDYLGFISNKDTNPVNKYSTRNTTFLIIKSWSQLSANRFIVRFSVNETAENKNIYNKIAVVDFNYTTMQLSEQERDINPVGFQVTGYRVDDDNS